MKRVLFAFLGAFLVALTGPVSGTAFTPETLSATRALNWIQQAQLGADGAVAADPTRTEEVVWGLVANHRPIATFVKAGSTKTPLDYLQANVASEEASAGNIAQLILAVTAAGQDPTSFGPIGATHDLMHDLQADYHAATGQFGSDIFSHILSILALRSANAVPPAAALAFLKSQQKADGSWSFDNADQFGTDSNTTALALVAFAASSSLDGCVVRNALGYLRGLQTQAGTGGFPLQPGFAPDPDSDAFVIEGLLAVGQDPTSDAWTIGGNKNAVKDMVSFQTNDGSFSYPGLGPDNVLATTQPLVALASTHLPLSPAGTSFAAPSVPACQSAASSPTPTAAPTPTPPRVVALPRTGSPASASMPGFLPAGLLFFGLLGLISAWRLWRRAR